MDILQKLADKYHLQTVDTWKLFEKMSIDKRRHDDVHFNRFGNRMLFKKCGIPSADRHLYEIYRVYKKGLKYHERSFF